MTKTRKSVAEECRVIQYGCGAHHMNLWAKDLAPATIVKKVTEIAQFFGNIHLPKAWLEDTGARKPPMPIDVRWNSALHLLEWYQEMSFYIIFYVNIYKIINEILMFVVTRNGQR